MTIRTFAAICAACSAFCAAPALGQPSPEPVPSPSPAAALGEIGRVSTSDRRDEPIGATSKTTYVVTKADIVRRGFTSVASALEDVPGVVVTRTGPVGSSASVALRGTSPNQTLVLIDGRPLAGAQIGTLDLGALPTAGVERIEVVEGSGATLYGTGAIGGVINVVTTPRNRRDTIATLSNATFGESAFVVDAPNFAFERRVARNGFAYPAFGSDPAGVRSDVDLASTSLRGRTATHLGGLGLALDAGIVARHLGAEGQVPFTTPGARQDDVDGDARSYVAHALRDDGFAVAVATSGDELLRTLAEGRYDVALVDADRLGMSTERFLARTNGTPLVRMGLRMPAALDGWDAFLTKPFLMKDLYGAVDVAIDHANGRRSNTPADP